MHIVFTSLALVTFAVASALFGLQAPDVLTVTAFGGSTAFAAVASILLMGKEL